MSSVINTREIAASAELLRERIRNGHATDAAADETERVSLEESTVEDLRSMTDVADVERYVHFDEWPADEPLPEWMETFTDLLDYLFDVDDPPSVPPEFDEELPFEEILFGLVEFGSRNLLADVDADLLSEAAVRDFQRYLVDRLLDVSGLALHMDYVSYVAERDSSVVSENRLSPQSTEWYDGYVSDFFEGRALIFFEEYPVLARVVAVLLRQWATLVSRFRSRLDDDYDAIASLLGTEDPGRVERVRAGAGDPHEEGQTVVIVEFESGDEIVYKPRGVDAEKAFYEFEDWLQREFDAFPRLETLEVLDQSEYGWVEIAEPGTFPDLASVKEYYRSAGALLFVLHLLNASDCHFENLVAGDVSPVIIDAETVLHTFVSITKTSNPDVNGTVLEWTLRSSVLKTLMLPYATTDQRVERSGLATLDEVPADGLTTTWEHLNTDAIDFDFKRPIADAEDNYPTFEGDPAPPDQFVDEIVDGFGAAYDEILQSKDAVKREVTERFGGVQVRQLIQPTNLYRALIKTLANPELLENGVKQDYKIRKTLSEKWAESRFVGDDREDLVRVESTAVFRRDVPRFSLSTDADELYFGEEVVLSDFFGETGIEQVHRTIEAMSESDKAYQQSMIRMTLGDFRDGFGADGGTRR